MGVRTNPMWWRWHLSTHTVIVGAGPSLITRRSLDGTPYKYPLPLGQYIDMFGTVIRLNDFRVSDPLTELHVGSRTARVRIQNGTLGRMFLSPLILFLAL
jgi:hypothetical protein